jgi:nitrate/TMAO reductase-like tetraheme cytochrome c subunit
MWTSDPLALIAIGFASLSALILLWFLVRRPKLGPSTKVLLLCGLGAFPIATAGTGNVAGYEATKERSFCGSCHVMEPWTEDSDDPDSQTLAARHSRNPMFGDQNCYTCHADYGQLGAVMTKIGGMRHVYEYVFNGYKDMSREEAIDAIHIRKPYPSSNCMQCHTTTTESWLAQSDHAQLVEEIRGGEVGCFGDGCHGPAHPFSKHVREEP